jgi:hypothetical protein
MKICAAAIFAVLFISAIVFGQPSDRTRYLNYEYKGVNPSSTLPNGVKHMGGGLIGDYEADPVYGISQVEKGKTKMLWLEVSTGRDSSGVTGWKVLDVLSFRALGPANYIFFSGDPAISCSRNGKEIPNLVGIGRIVRREGIFKPSNLWTADPVTKKFEPADGFGVKCEYSEP